MESLYFSLGAAPRVGRAGEPWYAKFDAGFLNTAHSAIDVEATLVADRGVVRATPGAREHLDGSSGPSVLGEQKVAALGHGLAVDHQRQA